LLACQLQVSVDPSRHRQEAAPIADEGGLAGSGGQDGRDGDEIGEVDAHGGRVEQLGREEHRAGRDRERRSSRRMAPKRPRIGLASASARDGVAES